MKLIPSKNFDRNLKKLLKNNPKYKAKITKTLYQLAENPSHPSLRVHKVYDIYYSVSVDMSIRIIYLLDKDKAYLLKIGTHDEVYN
jgi:mRNA-degrading endonuclease YafQ of YafQ-DinJ toxin-antitoxin module